MMNGQHFGCREVDTRGHCYLLWASLSYKFPVPLIRATGGVQHFRTAYALRWSHIVEIELQRPLQHIALWLPVHRRAMTTDRNGALIRLRSAGSCRHIGSRMLSFKHISEAPVTMRRIIYGVLLSLLAVCAVAQAPSVRTGTTEVLVDMVVRDKKAKIVRDLKPEEIQVLEDGVPQAIRHFELFEGHEPGDNTGPISAAPSGAALASTTPAAQAPLVRTLREATIVSVIVGSLNPEGRKSARDAVRDFIKNELRPNTFVGVFAWTYTGMQALQWYTNDGALISGAMERVVKWTGLRKIDDPDLLPDTVESATTPATTAPGPASEIASILATHWMTEYLDANDSSMRELLAMRSLVKAQAQLPGRKLVFLFAGGLIVHPDTVEVLNSAISAANRSNVTIYSVDTIRVNAEDFLLRIDIHGFEPSPPLLLSAKPTRRSKS